MSSCNGKRNEQSPLRYLRLHLRDSFLTTGYFDDHSWNTRDSASGGFSQKFFVLRWNAKVVQRRITVRRPGTHIGSTLGLDKPLRELPIPVKLLSVASACTPTGNALDQTRTSVTGFLVHVPDIVRPGLRAFAPTRFLRAEFLPPISTARSTLQEVLR
ncbi:hypothetical protein K457DRAFT_1815084 [Linnemannia elongata AG-77]|uniref:Uncharacterized protein n=1 Tax=Linnemannia elongata AG-77 TaxID=1314771 RepID=A0A197KF06_9FUNG|nr:hypothetical protein K457DRAFT_1815084 [Linnemannia elongata AG-77]